MKSITSQASDLLSQGNKTELENYLKMYLKKSYDIELWRIYVQYIREYQEEKLLDAYEYTLSRFGYHWEAYPLYQAYIDALLARDDTGRARNVFQRGLAVPMAGLPQLWKEYESFELELNKALGKKQISDYESVYQEALRNYNKLQQNISPGDHTLTLTLENFYFLVDFESTHKDKARKEMIFRYLLSQFPKSEEIYFCYCEYLVSSGMHEQAAVVINDAISNFNSPFLLFYYSTFAFEPIDVLFQEMITNENRGCHKDLVVINYLNYKLKFGGVEEFRKLFISLHKNSGPNVFIYVANAEYRITGSPKIAFNIFNRGLSIHPDNKFLYTEFLHFFIQIGDKINIQALFDRIEKTSESWDNMIEYEYRYGDNTRFRKLIEEREWIAEKEKLVPKYEIDIESAAYKRYKAYVKAFEFKNLRIERDSVLMNFISELPEVTRLKFDYEKIVNVLKSIILE
ncbi:Cleavage stimulation factor subunit 77 [Astathelohania contejeani]|uniref:Cleavage stimulation factor subunit 77 n=1 Tax=Astathelohania contejeani TaxID=164912 RepID=A0ABQ7I0F6_9MICR|nr:Cleavage stimulation factor subunit 77 [Thelohania contejeani]